MIYDTTAITANPAAPDQVAATGVATSPILRVRSHDDIATVDNADKWFQERHFAISGNKALQQDPKKITTNSSRIYLPTSTQQVAHVLANTSPDVPIACVCGGHESSNAALLADSNAIVLDFVKMKDISLDKDTMELTVQAGVVFEELANFVRQNKGALPIGTGASVGVVGYIVNGGISGYFSRRLGLLGQRVTKFTIILADGTVAHDVTRETNEELFLSVLGAGSSMGVVTEISFTMADESILQSASQFVAVFDKPDVGIDYNRKVLSFVRDKVLANDGVSMEMIYTAGRAIVITFCFYDNFEGSSDDYVESLKDQATSSGLLIVQDSSWTTWFEAASALWPVIDATSGSPLVLLQHSVGTTTSSPSDETLDFISESWISEAPLVDSTIVEVRTLGGAIGKLPAIPSGNAFHPFFSDTIVMYDAGNKSKHEMESIGDAFAKVVDKAGEVQGLSVDVSGTHSQVDDARRVVDPHVIFGSPEMATLVIKTKKCVDPNNRFRFHPFSKVLIGDSEPS